MSKKEFNFFPNRSENQAIRKSFLDSLDERDQSNGETEFFWQFHPNWHLMYVRLIGNSSSMLRESRLRKHRDREEHASSSNDDLIHNIWQKYRPKAAINFSDLVEERTMDAAVPSSSFSSPNMAKDSLEPSEITGRSTNRAADKRKLEADVAAVAAEMSIDMILGDSFVHEIRNMSTRKNVDSTDNRSSQNSLPVNNKKIDSIPIASASDMDWNRSCYEPPKMSVISVSSEDFVPFDQVCTV